MDSDPFASETVIAVSNQAGSLHSSSAQKSDIETLTKKPVMEFDDINNTSVSVSVSVNGDDGGSENEGFMSGEEEFETAPDKPILVYPDEKFTQRPIVKSPEFEFFTPMPIAKVSADDDDGGDNEDVEGDERGGRSLNFAGEDSEEKLGIGEYKEDSVQRESIENVNSGEMVKESGFGDSHEGFVEAYGGGDSKGSESVKLDENLHSVSEGGLTSEKDEEIVKEQNGDNGGDSKGPEILKLNEDFHSVSEGGLTSEKDEEVVKEQNGDNGGDSKGPEIVKLDENLHSVSEGGLTSEKNEEVVKELSGNGGGEVMRGDEILTVGTDYIKSVENGDVKLTSAGDTVVGTLEVDILKPGVVVVGDEEEINDSDIKGMEAPAHGVSVDNGFDPINEATEEPSDESGSRDVKYNQNADLEVDDDIEHAQEGLLGKKSVFDSLEDCENIDADADEGKIGSHIEASSEFFTSEFVHANISSSRAINLDEDGVDHHDGEEIDGTVSDAEGDDVIFGSSEAAKRFLEELEQHSGVVSQSSAESSRDTSQRIDGQVMTDSDEEVDTDDDEGDGNELFDSAALAALLKAATGAGQDGGSITITPQDAQRLFSVERPAGLGASLQSVKPASRPSHASLLAPNVRASDDSESNLSEEDRKKLEKLQQIRIKFLRLVQRLGYALEESLVAQVLYRLNLIAGRQTGQLFSLDAAKLSASQLEEEGKNDLDFSLNVLVLGKTGVGKSATINSIFGERKTTIDAYGPATTSVREIVGMVDGVKIRIFDTPGLKSSAMEQGFNQKVLHMVKKFTKRFPVDIVLYVDRLDTQSRDSNDLPLLKTISSVLGTSIWRNAIVTLTHAGCAPPDGPSGSPMSYEALVAQRSHIVQQHIGQAVGDLRLAYPSMMNIITLVENHPSCRKNRDGQKVLPNGQAWRPQLLLISYSMKILSEAGNLSKSQDSFDHRRLFGFRVRSPPLPYLLSWLLQSRSHPKHPAEQGGDNGDSDIELADLSDSDLDEDEDEYDQLPPFKPLRKSQISKLSKEQRKAYFEEYDYRVKLLQKKQWREELKRMRDIKKKGKTYINDYGDMDENDPENGTPAAVQVPLPDMVLAPSFDSDNPAYRYRFLEPTSQLLTRPVLDSQGWDHDCGYDGVNIEQTLAIVNRFPAAFTVQLRKDKKESSLHLDSSIAAKRGENQSIMAGFDIQNIGKQLAYIIRGETKFKILKRNKTGAGFSVTFLGENVSTGMKIEDQIAIGKRLAFVGSMGTVRSKADSAYGANVEVQLRDADYPVSQDQHSLGLSLVKWKGDLALGANFQSQVSLGRSYKMAVRAGLNNKLSGQFTVRTSSSDQLQIALLAVLPIAKAIYQNFRPGAAENYSIY
ncbi:hypothetical protein L6164_029619 [Bauhinia variegata]|uniref:Uncharacterized protein n=1 Tax=Bauhinia variegata TaxID=167791 RepID=A0ACB9L9P8_BAUVA|nr:hypothetical protein L6164_029619 [Bauhinia variegata]